MSKVKDDDNKNKLEKLKSEITKATASGPEALKKIILKILKSSLPLEYKTELVSIATKAIAEVSLPDRGKLNEVNAQSVLKTVEEEKARYTEQVKPIYDKFDSFHKDYLGKQTIYTDTLEKALQEAAAGKDISPDLEQELKDARTILKKDETRIAEIRNTGKVAAEEQEYHLNKIIEVDKAKIQIIPTELTPQQLDEARKFHVTCLGEANTKLAEVAKHHEEEAKQAAIIEKGIELAKKSGNIKAQQIWQEQKEDLIGKPSVANEKTHLTPELIVGIKRAKETMARPSTNNQYLNSKKIKGRHIPGGNLGQGEGRGNI